MFLHNIQGQKHQFEKHQILRIHHILVSDEKVELEIGIISGCERDIDPKEALDISC